METANNKSINEQKERATPRRVGLLGLIFIVISAMIGGGVFMMPAQMANPEGTGNPVAGPGAEIIAWLITAIGMWFLVCVFRLLSRARPDLKAGMFSYAHVGFGKLIGFLVAWGYWLFNVVSCAAYGILVMSTLHYFFPDVFTTSNGNSLLAIICASVLSWLMVFLASRGARESAALNIVGTIAKIIPIVAFIVVCAFLFNPQTFTSDFWGVAANQEYLAAQGTPALFAQDAGTVFLSGTPAQIVPWVLRQVGPCMMVTLWVFLGIEGAVVISGEAKSQRDVSRATLIGFLVTLCIYVLVSLLPFGLYTPQMLAHQFANPSMGTIMADHFGSLGVAFINIGIICSVLSAWLVWILLLSQMPLYAARENLFPVCFKKQNKRGAPTVALWWTGAIAQVILIASFFLTGNTWDFLTNAISAMAAPCYLFCALYLLKLALASTEWKDAPSRARALLVGIGGSLFGLFLVIAGKIDYLRLACIVYALGIPFFLFTRYRYAGSWKACVADIGWPEWIMMALLILLGLVMGLTA